MDAADILSERLMVRTNGAQGPFANRRDKKVQQELIKAAGIRSVRQAAGKKFSDVEDFLHKEHYPVVLKPTDSGKWHSAATMCIFIYVYDSKSLTLLFLVSLLSFFSWN